jgi:hypothetical protein
VVYPLFYECGGRFKGYIRGKIALRVMLLMKNVSLNVLNAQVKASVIAVYQVYCRVID